MQTDSRRPDIIQLLEVQRGMSWVAFQEFEGLVGGAPNFSR
jgi:hypothetical protein